ncbi:hypothetical protein GGR56DRAFT_13286 [Xylariaceae sp. FL0804]|nr:hypothetical protein GGR56DRAFT_13286 [Xylariaceae sp. FL0804]
MNKNWNDRADKDLFFTILSVKNIGVISGAEWTTIGNHMRSLGYGFTNEGCRQHFQGLRRAQHKAETNGASSDSPRSTDPTMNPITRRPGPGRGRPRKLPPAPVVTLESFQPQPGVLPPNAVPPDALPPGEHEGQAITTAAPVSIPMQAAAGAPDPEPLGMAQDEVDLDDQPAKRPRLDEDGRQSHDEEPVLALVADGLPGPEDYHVPSEYYGDA